MNVDNKDTFLQTYDFWGMKIWTAINVMLSLITIARINSINRNMIDGNIVDPSSILRYRAVLYPSAHETRSPITLI